jgi:hypothetical protein
MISGGIRGGKRGGETNRDGRGEERGEEVAEVGEILEPLIVLLLPEPLVPVGGVEVGGGGARRDVVGHRRRSEQ